MSMHDLLKNIDENQKTILKLLNGKRNGPNAEYDDFMKKQQRLNTIILVILGLLISAVFGGAIGTIFQAVLGIGF